MNKVTLFFFATLRDITGERSVTKTIPDDIQILDLKELLVNDYPGLKDIMPSIIVSLDHEFAFDNALIPSGAEIALFPPVSGG